MLEGEKCVPEREREGRAPRLKTLCQGEGAAGASAGLERKGQRQGNESRRISGEPGRGKGGLALILKLS